MSRTFHGRDVFAPVSRAPGNRRRTARLGPAVPPDHLHRLPDPWLAVAAGALGAEVLTVDTFGNVQLAATAADLAAAGLRTG